MARPRPRPVVASRWHGAGARGACCFVRRWQVEGGTGRAGRRDGARAARVALSPESRAPRNACIIIMTDADRAAAPLICGAFDLAARAGPAAPAAQTSRPLTFIRFDAALPVVRPFALALNRGFYLVNSGSATEPSAGRASGRRARASPSMGSAAGRCRCRHRHHCHCHCCPTTRWSSDSAAQPAATLLGSHSRFVYACIHYFGVIIMFSCINLRNVNGDYFSKNTVCVWLFQTVINCRVQISSGIKFDTFG